MEIKRWLELQENILDMTCEEIILYSPSNDFNLREILLLLYYKIFGYTRKDDEINKFFDTFFKTGHYYYIDLDTMEKVSQFGDPDENKMMGSIGRFVINLSVYRDRHKGQTVNTVVIYKIDKIFFTSFEQMKDFYNTFSPIFNHIKLIREKKVEELENHIKNLENYLLTSHS